MNIGRLTVTLATAVVMTASCGGASPTTSGPSLAERLAWTEGLATPDGCIVASAEDITRESGFTITQTTPILSGQPGCLVRQGRLVSPARVTGTLTCSG